MCLALELQTRRHWISKCSKTICHGFTLAFHPGQSINPNAPENPILLCSSASRFTFSGVDSQKFSALNHLQKNKSNVERQKSIKDSSICIYSQWSLQPRCYWAEKGLRTFLIWIFRFPFCAIFGFSEIIVAFKQLKNFPGMPNQHTSWLAINLGLVSCVTGLHISLLTKCTSSSLSPALCFWVSRFGAFPGNDSPWAHFLPCSCWQFLKTWAQWWLSLPRRQKIRLFVYIVHRAGFVWL